MRLCSTSAVLLLLSVLAPLCEAQKTNPLSESLTFHASFDNGIDADFSRGDRTCYLRRNDQLVKAEPNENVTIADGAGRFGDALHFTRKSSDWPLFKGADVFNYNDKSWDATVSVWLRLNPDKDLEPGYCDPVQIVGGDVKKGFIFMEWSKDHTPRYFRFAIWPLYEIWNPTDVGWEEIPAEKRPLVQIKNAPFASDQWTHAVFTLENINDDTAPSTGTLYLNGERMGAIEGWDLKLGWKPEDLQLVLGAAYVGHLDDVAVFNRTLTPDEVKQVYQFKNGVRDLYARE